jgi:hypothetical protein
MTNPFSNATMTKCASVQQTMAVGKAQGKLKGAKPQRGRRQARGKTILHFFFLYYIFF